MANRNLQHFLCPPTLLCLLTLSSVHSSFGQVKIDVEEANVSGKIVRISPLSLTMKTSLGEFEVDVVNREFRDLGPARIEVKGEKPRKFLKPGMTVRFAGKVEHGRKIRDPLTEIFVVDSAAPVRLGGAVPGGEGERPEAAEDAGELIVGRIRILRRNALSVETSGRRGPRVLQAKLADDSVVKILSGNLSAARPGDKVQVKGWKEAGGRARQIWAEQVTVTSSAEPPDPRLARGAKPQPGGSRRAFGDIAEEAKEDAAEDDSTDYEGVILEIN